MLENKSIKLCHFYRSIKPSNIWQETIKTSNTYSFWFLICLQFLTHQECCNSPKNSNISFFEAHPWEKHWKCSWWMKSNSRIHTESARTTSLEFRLFDVCFLPIEILNVLEATKPPNDKLQQSLFGLFKENQTIKFYGYYFNT